MRQAVKSWDEQDAYTRWRHVLHWRPGEVKRVKRRTHKRERREEVTELRAYRLGPAPEGLFADHSDCRHGCNGDCVRWGGPTCDFTCHEEAE